MSVKTLQWLVMKANKTDLKATTNNRISVHACGVNKKCKKQKQETSKSCTKVLFNNRLTASYSLWLLLGGNCVENQNQNENENENAATHNCAAESCWLLRFANKSIFHTISHIQTISSEENWLRKVIFMPTLVSLRSE